MSIKTGLPSVFSGDFLVLDEANPSMDLGAEMKSSDGRSFRYVLAGGTTLVVGNLQQAPAEDTGDQNITPTAAAIGDTSVLTSSTMTVTANQYAGGWMIVSITPGVGYQYRIRSHPAATAAALTFRLEDPIQVALTTTSRVDFVANPYGSVVVNPTTATSAPVGIAVNNITNAQYGFIQTRGVATILSDGGSTVGTNVSASNATAGAVEAAVTAQAFVGTALTGVATTDYGAFLVWGIV